MSAAASFTLVLVLVLAVAGPLLLYVLIQDETKNPTVMDRADAERTVRKDRRSSEDDWPGEQGRSSADGDDWSTDSGWTTDDADDSRRSRR
ncbi:hypothetical protein [Haloarchaeobius sp. DFWS5]|uniref:hypothetical protein n=1 Tax=Haloarchaeobius sp. DFWS5 TaxID=3446114 RepID=UPI003EBE7BE0